MDKPENTAKIVQFIFVASLVPALIGSLMLTLLWIEYWPLLFGLMAFIFLGHFLIRYLGKQQKNVNWFLSIAILNLLILTPEVFLRLSQFHYETGIQFGFPRSFQKFTPHEDLFWTLPANQAGISSLGFPGDEIKIPKSVEVCRILFLGDSVPMQGYPDVVETLLNQQPLEKPAESVSLAMAGYSTYQGRVLVNKFGEVIAPDIVVVAYGWNDHWLAYGAIDSQKVIEVDQTWPQRTFTFVYTNMRLLQWIRYLLTPVLGANVALDSVRVPLAEYVENLIHIGEFFEGRDVPVVFITPPSAHYMLGVPDELVDDGFAVNKESVIELHKAYNQALRDTAEPRGWLILEQEETFAASPDLSRIFIYDGIHLTENGLNVIAQHIADFISGKSCLVPQS